jgi:hypothetical protein
LSFAQKKAKIVKTSGEAQITLTEDKSRKQVKDEAKQHAIIDAIENAFGTVVVRGNATYISNTESGDESETKTSFNTIANTTVKGEVEEILKEDYVDINRDDGLIDIMCKIKIRAREILEVPVDFESSTLSGNTKNNNTEKFYDGDDLFFYFKSPISGYITLYVDVNGTTERILPYQNMPAKYENGIPVEADKEYIFFSKDEKHKYFNDENIDEIYLSMDSDIQEIWRLFAIFSKEPLNKPKLNINPSEDKLTEQERSKKITVPKSLPSEDFQRWKIKNQQFNKDMQVKIIDITIEKK